MRYFIKDFKEKYNKSWSFGKFPAYNYYPSTGTHIGNDFVVVIGTQIFAPADGEMVKVFHNKYKGNVGIYIFKHKDIEWGLELCHLKELPNTGVFKEGDIIAFSGNTGSTGTGAHLHAVLHKDAMVTKNYQRLKSREGFLQLEKNGSIVNCFEWFCNNINKEDTEILDVKNEVLITTAISSCSDILNLISKNSFQKETSYLFESFFIRLRHLSSFFYYENSLFFKYKNKLNTEDLSIIEKIINIRIASAHPESDQHWLNDYFMVSGCMNFKDKDVEIQYGTHKLFLVKEIIPIYKKLRELCFQAPELSRLKKHPYYENQEKELIEIEKKITDFLKNPMCILDSI